MGAAINRRNYVIVAVVILWLNVLTAQWYVNYENGKKQLKAEEWKAAVQELTQAIRNKREPKARAKTYGLNFIDYFPYFYRAMAYYNLDKLDEASNDLKISRKYGKVKKAFQDKTAYQKMVVLNEQIAGKKIFKEGIELLKKNQHEAAIKRFETVMRFSTPPPEAQTYLNKAKTQFSQQSSKAKLTEALKNFKRKQYDLAINGFEQFLQISPNHTKAARYLKKARKHLKIQQQFELGLLAYQEKNYKEAIEHFESVKQLDPQHQKVNDYIQITQLHLQKSSEKISGKKNTEAISQYFQEAIQLYKQDSLDAALLAFNAVLQLDPNHIAASQYLALLQEKQNSSSSAMNNTLAQRQPDSNNAAISLQNQQLNTNNAINNILAQNKPGSSAAISLQNQQQKTNSTMNKPLTQNKSGSSSAPGLMLDTTNIKKFLEIDRKIRSAITAFYQGDYPKVIRLLEKQAKTYDASADVHAFLACAYATQYFLGGETNKELYNQAIIQFRRLNKVAPDYAFQNKFISPRLISMFKKGMFR